MIMFLTWRQSEKAAISHESVTLCPMERRWYFYCANAISIGESVNFFNICIVWNIVCVV